VANEEKEDMTDPVTNKETAGPKEVVLKFLGLMSSGAPEDSEAALQLFAEDAVLWIAGSLPFSGTKHGRQEMLETVYRPARQRMVRGSKSLRIGTILAEGELVAVEWTSRRMTPDGKDYQNDFFGLFSVRDGEIQSLREYLDTLHAKETNWPDSPKRTP
jgi:ketosteroid isomerase-like protein